MTDIRINDFTIAVVDRPTVFGEAKEKTRKLNKRIVRAYIITSTIEYMVAVHPQRVMIYETENIGGKIDTCEK